MNHRIALIGSGKWGAHLARVLARLNVLSAVCDVQRDRAAEIAALYGVRAAADWNDILQDASVSAVVIATPASSHARLAREALLSGKDVLVEKPMALSVEDAEELVHLAAEHRRILMVGHVVQYHPAVDALKKLIAAGELGAIRYIQCHRLNFGRVRPAESILWSFAPHDVSLIISLLGMPETVHCTSAAWRPDGTPDMTISQCTFASGAGAHIYVSWLHPYKEQRMTVIGEKGMAVFDGIAPSLSFHAHNLSSPLVAEPLPPQSIPFSADEPLERECSAFLESMMNRTDPLTNALEGLQVLRVLDACQRSHRSGQAEPVLLNTNLVQI